MTATNRFTAIAMTLVLLASGASSATEQGAITITRSASLPSSKGPAEYFTGPVRVDPLFQAKDEAQTSLAYVNFEPGARSAWHTHPRGQVLMVTAGTGRVQRWGDPVEEIRPGDVIWIPPGQKHWHGASPSTGMTHLAMTAAVEGKNVDWLEKVSDEQYGSAAPASGVPRAEGSDVRSVAPVLERYGQATVTGDLWKRPGLSPRDRSVVTLAALIARNQAAELPQQIDAALDRGVKPREVSEIITHLAFYSGWGNARSAVAAAKEVYARRRIGTDQLPAAAPALLLIDEKAEADRAMRVEQQFGKVFPGVVQYTTDPVFRDLWLRPDLAPRDRSLVTVSALIASGQMAHVPYHLNRAMDNGLTQTETSEALTQLAFYAGWPNVFSAMPVVKEVFEKRAAK